MKVEQGIANLTEVYKDMRTINSAFAKFSMVDLRLLIDPTLD